MLKMETKKLTLDEQEVVQRVTDQFLLSKRYLDTIHQRMNEQEELYRTYIDPNNYPHSARVFDPRVFRVIETVTPRMVANEPTGSFYPTQDGDIATANILNALIKYDWRRAEMFPKLVTYVKSMLIFGTAFGRTHWDFREREKQRMVAKKVNGKMLWTPKNTEKIMVTEFDGPNFEPLNIYDCFPDPNSTSVSNMRWFVYRTWKTLDELEMENDVRGSEYYKNLDVLKQAVANMKHGDKGNNPTGTGGGQASDKQFREHRRIMLSTQEYHGQDESNPEFVILRCFEKDRWIDIAPEYGIVIRDCENPYFHGELPIIHGVDYPYPGELYGMGEIEPIDRIQRAINAVLNQRLDNVQLTLRTMWKVRTGGGVDMHTLISAPGNIVTTKDMNAVEPITVPDVTGSTFVQTMNYLTSAMQNGSGITDYTTGLDGSNGVANKTATGTRLIQSEANAQFKLKIQLFNHMVVQRIANHWKDLRIQYTTDKQKLRIIGEDQVNNMKENTNLSQVDMQGQPIAPGDLEAKSKLQVSDDGNFAFLHLLPEDIQPAIVGDYDFITTIDVEQLNDPTVTQQNFFAALDRIMSPEWSQMLFRNGKMLNVMTLTQKIFEKLQVGVDGKDVLSDFPKGQNFNFDMPKVDIRYEDLPPDGKVQAAANAGIDLDPKDPQLQQMGKVDTRITVDAPTQGTEVLQTEGFLPKMDAPQDGPMNHDQIQQMLQGQQVQNPLQNPLDQAAQPLQVGQQPPQPGQPGGQPQ